VEQLKDICADVRRALLKEEEFKKILHIPKTLPRKQPLAKVLYP
jgi:hypothetical protein